MSIQTVFNQCQRKIYFSVLSFLRKKFFCSKGEAAAGDGEGVRVGVVGRFALSTTILLHVRSLHQATASRHRWSRARRVQQEVDGVHARSCDGTRKWRDAPASQVLQRCWVCIPQKLHSPSQFLSTPSFSRLQEGRRVGWTMFLAVERIFRASVTLLPTSTDETKSACHDDDRREWRQVTSILNDTTSGAPTLCYNTVLCFSKSFFQRLYYAL